MDEAIHVRIGNRKPAIGRMAAIVEVARLFGDVQALGRQFREVWPGADGETVLMELDLITGSDAVIPLAIVLRVITPGLIKDLRFYLDPTPLGLPPRAGADSVAAPH